MRATLVDADGNAGPPATAAFAVGEKGPAAPEVSRATWRKDGRVVVRGSGFDGPGLVALVDGAPVPIAEASDGQLVLLAANDAPATVEIRTDLGAAAAPGLVGPRPTIEIVPAGATVAEGSSAQFHAVVLGVSPTPGWSGASTPQPASPISADGVLAVGHGAPSAVVVRARSAAAGVETTCTVQVAAPDGRGATIGPRGGTQPRRRRRRLTIPAGALDTSAEIVVEPKKSRLVQRGVVVGAEVKLTAVDLNQPASIEIPLRVHAEPGSVVDVLFWEGGEWIPTGHADGGRLRLHGRPRPVAAARRHQGGHPRSHAARRLAGAQRRAVHRRGARDADRGGRHRPAARHGRELRARADAGVGRAGDRRRRRAHRVPRRRS